MLTSRFGNEVADPDSGELDKRALFRLMAGSAEVRREVERMIHPMVRHALEMFWEEHAGAEYTVAEVPLLFESGWPNRFDLVAGVDCPEEARVEFLRGRGVDEETRAVLDSWQWSREDKLKGCDFVADNSGSREDLRARAEELAEAVRGLRRERQAAFFEFLDGLWDSLGASSADDAPEFAEGRDASKGANQEEPR